MNKTIDVSLAGMLFHLEESAYYKIKKYLKHVRNSLDNTSDTDEIMNEIEARIAELLSQKQAHPQQVIDEKSIDEIIEIIGKPEDFEEEQVENTKHTKTGISKKLFRDFDKHVIGGVAAGFAHYVGMDITLMRIIFIILLFVSHGSFILLYLLLWIIIPKAVTASDKLKMRGEKVNIDNIVEQVSTEEPDKKKLKFTENIENSGSEIGSLLVRLIGFVIAFIAGIVLLTLVISVLSLSSLSDFHLVVDEVGFFGNSQIPFMWFNILSHIIIGIPFLFLFLVGIKMLFPNTKKLSSNFYWIAGTIWLISLIVLSVKSVSVLSHKSSSGIVEETYPIYYNKDTLDIKCISENYLEQADFKSNNKIKIDFSTSPDSLFHIKIYKKSEGLTGDKARENADKIRYKYQLDTINDALKINTKLYYPKNDVIVEHKLKYVIEIPNNKAVKKLDDLSYYNYYYRNCKNGDVLINRNGELKCNDKENNNEAIKISNDRVKISIDENGVKVKANDNNGENAEISIDKNGVKIKTNK